MLIGLLVSLLECMFYQMLLLRLFNKNIQLMHVEKAKLLNLFSFYEVF
jgi:hypothetical protein